MVMLEKSALSLGQALLPQLREAGTVLPPSTLVLHPLEVFSFTLSMNSFQGTSPTTRYYAVLSDGSALPSWLRFDAATLEFSGRTPSLTPPALSQQEVDIKLTASDTTGLSEASISFAICIMSQSLAFTVSSSVMPVVPNEQITILSLLSRLKLGGESVLRSDLALIDSQQPAWLYFNRTELSYSGIVPENVENTIILLRVTDNQGSNASIQFSVQTTSHQFPLSINVGQMTARVGSYFNYTFDEMAVNDDTIAVGADLGSLTNSISFDARNLSLHGTVPDSVRSPSVNVTVYLIGDTTFRSLYLVVNLSELTTRTTGTMILNTAFGSGVPTRTATISTPLSQHRGTTVNKHALILSLVVVLPVITVLGLACLLLFWVHKRASKKKADNQKTEDKALERATRLDHKRPVMELSGPAIANLQDQSVQSNEPTRSSPPSQPLVPQTDTKIDQIQIQGSLAPSSNLADPMSDALTRLPRDVSIKNKPLADMSTTASRSSVHKPITGRQVMVSQSSQGQRSSDSSISMTAQVIGLSGRLSAAGHGSGGNHPSFVARDRLPRQAILRSVASLESRPKTISSKTESTLELRATTNQSTTGKASYRGNQIIHQSKRGIMIDSQLRSFELARQQYFTEKARDRFEVNSRFSNNVSAAKSRRRSGYSSLQSKADQRECLTSNNVDNDCAFIKWTVACADTLPQRHSTEEKASTHATTRALSRHVSMASSRQFDSAASSDSSQENEKNGAILNQQRTNPGGMSKDNSGSFRFL